MIGKLQAEVQDLWSFCFLNILGVQMLTLIVPVLINFLDDAACTPQAKMLHELSLHKLMKIGPQYPQVAIT